MSQSGTFGTGGGVQPVLTLTGDTGGPISPDGAGNINTVADVAALNCGATVLIKGAGHTLTLDVTDANGNTIIGQASGNATLTGIANTVLGFTAATDLTTGGNNVVIGYESTETLTTGDYNTILGASTGTAYTGAESSNIIIGYHTTGTLGESHVLRIGNATGAGNGNLSEAFICGINGVNVGSVASVVSISGDHLGSTVITAGTGITVTPGANTITISGSGTTTLNYTNVHTSPYVVLATDQYLSVDSSGGPITVELPNAATTGRTYTIKDRTGSAAIHNITVTTVGGVVDIDGAATFVMNTAYESINVMGNSTSYEVF